MNHIETPGRGIKRIHCLRHVDRTPSLTLYADGHFHCFSCSWHGWIDELNGEKTTRRKEVIEKPKSWPSLDWNQYKNQFKKEHAQRLSKWRGYPLEPIWELVRQNYLGIYKDQFCFPIHQEGRIVRLHVRIHEELPTKHPWFCYPSPGASVGSLVIGRPYNNVHIFESQWDMIALMSQRWDKEMFISTRGAAKFNTLGKINFPPHCYIWPQNDEAGERWLEGVMSYLPEKSTKQIIRVPNKDANEYLLSGGNFTTLF